MTRFLGRMTRAIGEKSAYIYAMTETNARYEAERQNPSSSVFDFLGASIDRLDGN